MGNFAADFVYVVFAPSGAELLFPHESETIFLLFGGALVSAGHLLFLSIAILWVRRWSGWRDYLNRWAVFVIALLASIAAFLALGFFYRHSSSITESRVYVRDLPVVAHLFAVFVVSVIVTFVARKYFGGAMSPGGLQDGATNGEKGNR